ncbi:MAG: hypothetical protein JO197_07785 [Acidobacteria bacterium]|nr:hypothetical protein [Acidobacteriota bacterium]MBV9475882.1 hypothetical protein [Acidobacteriota bacterium]
MITGFNTDIKHNEKVYHVQTEDKGVGNPYIESLVYVGGEILASKKTSYAEQLKSGVDDKWIGGLMEQQHRTMIAAIKRGRFDAPADTTKASQKATMDGSSVVLETPAAPAPVSGSAPLSTLAEEKTLDQVIIDYLASEAESEHLELALLDQLDFFAGASIEMRIAARKSLSQAPIPAAAIEVKVISTVEPPRVIFRGKTAADGTATVRCTIPLFREGTAAVIISAQSPIGNDEVKQLVKRRK